jgi:hypothetical protein
LPADDLLLLIGNEGSVDKLLKQIGGFMSDIADDFKIVVVEAIRSLCLKFPAKHRSLMSFLSNVLREEGGFEYKKAIVNAILALIQVRLGHVEGELDDVENIACSARCGVRVVRLDCATSGEQFM